MCKSPIGCKIEELAQDKEVTRLAEVFISIRALLHNEMYRPLALDALKKEGLDDPSLLYEVEKRVGDYIKKQDKKTKKSKAEEPQTREMI